MSPIAVFNRLQKYFTDKVFNDVREYLNEVNDWGFREAVFNSNKIFNNEVLDPNLIAQNVINAEYKEENKNKGRIDEQHMQNKNIESNINEHEGGRPVEQVSAVGVQEVENADGDEQVEDITSDLIDDLSLNGEDADIVEDDLDAEPGDDGTDDFDPGGIRAGLPILEAIPAEPGCVERFSSRFNYLLAEDVSNLLDFEATVEDLMIALKQELNFKSLTRGGPVRPDKHMILKKFKSYPTRIVEKIFVNDERSDF